MKKSILTIVAIIFATITFGQVLGDFPVSPNQGGITEAANRQRIADDGGSYLSNIAPHQLDVLTSYGIVPDNLMIPSGRKASVLYSQYPTDGTGDFTVINAAVKNEIVDGKLREIAANIAGFNYTFGYPVLEVNEATENLIEDPVTLGSDYWTLLGATIEGDPSTAGVDITGGLDLTVGTEWVLNNLGSIDDADSFTSSGASTDGIVYLNTASTPIVVGNTYQIILAGSTTSSGFTLGRADASGNEYGSGFGTHYFHAEDDQLWIRQNTAGTTDFTALTIKVVTGFPSPHADSPLDVSAFKLVEDDQTSTHYFTKSAITVTNGVTLTQSIYAKQGERNWLRFEEINSADGYYFDLENGVVGTEIGTTVASSIIAAANGYWRISITVTVPSTAAEFRVGLADADNSNSYAGDGSSGLFIAFAQIEELPYASTWTFIAEGGTSSKIADQINNSTFSGNSAEGVLSVKMAAFADDGTERVIAISDGTTDNVVRLYYSSTTQRITGDVYVGSSLQAAMSYDVSDVTDFTVASIRWREDDFSLWIDGIERATDVSGSVPAFEVLDEFSLDDGAGGNDFYGYIQWSIISEYLNDTQMGSLK